MTYILNIFCFLLIFPIVDNVYSQQKKSKINLSDTTLIYSLLNKGEKFENINVDSSYSFYIQAIELSKRNYEQTKYIAFLSAQAESYNYLASYNLLRGNTTLALENYRTSLKLDSVTADNHRIANTLTNMASIFRTLGDVDKAFEYLDLAKEKFIVLKLNNKIATVYQEYGRLYYEKGDYINALKYYQEALQKIDSINTDKPLIAALYLNIGMTNAAQNNSEFALEYYKKSLKAYTELGSKNNIANCLLNIGIIYKEKYSDYKKALEYYKKALDIHTEQKNLKGISACNNNIAGVFYKIEDYKLALDAYKKNILIKREICDKKGEIIALYNISACNFNLNNFYESLKYALEGYEKSYKSNYLYESNIGAKKIYESYDTLKDYKNALKYHVIFMNLNDSIYNIEKEKNFSKLESQYQNKQKRLEIENLNKENLLKENELILKNEKLNYQNNMIFIFIGIIILVSIFLFIVLKLLKDKKKANILLTIQNEEIKQKNEEITAQRDEIEAQSNLVIKQKEHIENIHTELQSSIRYAKTIQEAMLPVLSPKPHNSNLNSQVYEFGVWNLELETFVLYLPKDIVSGDFYWFSKVNEQLIYAVADCTGHGVPGAFMSMLGIAFLNEIINKELITSPDEILNKLRDNVIKSLNKQGQSEQSNDGMDICIVVIDKENNIIEYAGANNPLYMVTQSSGLLNYETEVHVTGENASANDKPQTSTELASSTKLNLKLFEHKPDKMPIGIGYKTQNFSKQIIKCESGDLLYLMSDGFKDQIGEKSNKKYLSKNLKNLILEVSHLTMNEQKEKFERAFIDWCGNNEQTDDVCIIGIKI